MRRSFTFTSACIAALTLAWSATPVAAGVLTAHASLSATSEQTRNAAHALTGTHVLSATAGSLPAQLGAFPGGSELAAIAAAGSSGNTAVTTPADPSIAAGPSSVVEAVNSAVFIYARTGGTPTVFAINTMINNPVTSGWAVRYPHVIYDPVSGRFILMVLEFSASACGSQIAMMESQANPALAWTPRGSLSIDSQLQPPPGGKWVFGDVALALTATLVVESSDYQACTSGTLGAFAASQTNVIQRADLFGTMTVNSVAFQAGGPIGVQPVMGLGLSGVAYEIANDANCSAVQAGTVAVFTITGTPDSRNVSNACSGVTSSFSESSGSSVPPEAPQAGTTTATLQTDDDRFLDAVWENNTLWATGNTGCKPGELTTRACINVVQATATTTGAVSGGSQLTPEGVSGKYLYYPSLAVDTSGNVTVTFDESSASAPEAMMLASITGGTTWSSTFLTLRSSAAFYSPNACTSCSWGDYSAALQDAFHPTDVWVVSEENDGNTGIGCPPPANSCWNTYIARYTFAGPTISALTPSSGPGGGGQTVLVSGSDFANPTTATIGGSPIAISNVTPDSFTFTTPPGPAAGGLVHVVATSAGSSSPTSTGSGYLYIPLSTFTAMTPFRILDTRSQGPALGPGVTRVLQISGVGVTPVPSTAVAVVLNVTAVGGTSASLLSLYPTGTPAPSTSNLNFRAGTATPNLVTVTLGTGGAVSIMNALGTVNVVVDVQGYFAPPVSETAAGEFHPIAPLRVCDTRSLSSTAQCRAHGAVVGGTPMVVTVTGGTIPNGGTVASVVLNLTAVAGTEATYLSVFPTTSSGTCAYNGGNPPRISNLNVLAGIVQANRVMVALGNGPAGANSAICVYNALGSINVVLDANGWFGTSSAPTGYQYQPVAPARICDTRTGAGGCSLGALGVGSRPIRVAGEGGVPGLGGGNPVVHAVIVNLTGIAPTQATYLVLYPASLHSAPLASDINLSAGLVLPNLAVVQLDTTDSSAGYMDLYNPVGSVNAAIDVEGWFQ